MQLVGHQVRRVLVVGFIQCGCTCICHLYRLKVIYGILLCKLVSIHWLTSSKIFARLQDFPDSSLTTVVTRLFDANVDEQLIMTKTGHVSNAVTSERATTSCSNWPTQLPAKRKMHKAGEDSKASSSSVPNESDNNPGCSVSVTDGNTANTLINTVIKSD